MTLGKTPCRQAGRSPRLRSRVSVAVVVCVCHFFPLLDWFEDFRMFVGQVQELEMEKRFAKFAYEVVVGKPVRLKLIVCC